MSEFFETGENIRKKHKLRQLFVGEISDESYKTQSEVRRNSLVQKRTQDGARVELEETITDSDKEFKTKDK